MPQENQEKQVTQVLLVLRDLREIRDHKDLQEKRCEYFEMFKSRSKQKDESTGFFFLNILRNTAVRPKLTLLRMLEV